MRIIIEYNSIWGNSFISEDKKNGKLRKYICSRKNLKNPENFIEKRITLDTAKGILYRLCGAINKLYQFKNSDNIIENLFRENKVEIINIKKSHNNEVIYLRNSNLSKNKKEYSGFLNNFITENDYKKISNISKLDKNELINFILYEEKKYNNQENINIIQDLIDLINTQYKNKKIIINKEDNEELFNKINNKYKEIIPKELTEKKLNLFFVALNILTNKEFKEYDNLTKYKTFAGIGLNCKGFTHKDFYGKMAKQKIIAGNPYIFFDKEKKQFKGVNKSDGLLIIEINDTIEKENKIHDLIKNAAVSSFYVGKKGLGFIKEIEF